MHWCQSFECFGYVPGVYPVGVDETLRRIVGKAVCMSTHVDTEDLCGVDQLCQKIRLRLRVWFMP